MSSSPRILGHLIVETVRSVLGGERLHRLSRMYGNMPATLNGTLATTLEPLSMCSMKIRLDNTYFLSCLTILVAPGHACMAFLHKAG
jgi:hypothetical protein